MNAVLVSMDDKIRWAEAIPGFKATGKTEGVCLCPYHNDHNPSLWIGFEAQWGRFECRACREKGNLKELAERLGLPPFPGTSPRDSQDRGELESTYIYTNPDGADLLKVERRRKADGKTFLQFHKNGAEWKSGGIKPTPLWRANELKEAPAGSTVWFVEGEKSAESGNRLGVLTTTAPEGAGKAYKVGDSYWDLLRGKKTIILPDNDETGRKHAQNVARILTGKGIEAWILDLPGLKAKGDLADWAPGKTKADLEALLPTAVPAQPSVLTKCETALVDLGKLDSGTVADPSVPTVNVGREIPPIVVVRTVLGILKTSRTDGHPKWVANADGICLLDSVRGELLRMGPKGLRRIEGDVNFVTLARKKEGDRETVEAKPTGAPPGLCETLAELVSSELGLPEVDQIVAAPVYDEEGNLIDRPGYHSGPKVYYCPPPDLNIPPVPKRPTPSEVSGAVSLLMELIHDFPFVKASDRAAALAIPLSVVARRLTGLCPMLLVSAATNGTGKGLLLDVLLYIYFGPAKKGLIFSGPPVGEEDSIAKALQSVLLAGPQAAQFDNLEEDLKLKSPTLCAIETQEVIDFRLLGVSKMARARNNVVWIASGNNPDLSDEIARRTITIRLDAGVERPECRTGFLHSDLRGWARENRGRLLCSVLTLVSHWVAEGRPMGAQVLGSFETWARTIGGILGAAGVEGFLEDRETSLLRTDSEREEWRGLLQEWWASHRDARVTTSDIVEIVRRLKSPAKIYGRPSDQSQVTTLGAELRKKSDRVYSGLRIERLGLSKGVSGYRLVRVEDTTTTPPPSEFEMPF